jgi:hypothetical protein
MDRFSQAISSAVPTGPRTNNANGRDSPNQAISTAANSNFAAILEEKRRRTLVLRNVPEAAAATPSHRQLADEAFTTSVLDSLNLQVRPIAIFRLGKPSPEKPRFLMVELPTRSHLVEALRNGCLLKECDDYKHIYVGQSMTREERQKWSAQRIQRRQSSTQATLLLPSQPAAIQPPVEAQPQPTSPIATADMETDNDPSQDIMTPEQQAVYDQGMALIRATMMDLRDRYIKMATGIHNARAKFCKANPKYKPRPPPIPAQLKLANLNAKPTLDKDVDAAYDSYKDKLQKWCTQQNIPIGTMLD